MGGGIGRGVLGEKRSGRGGCGERGRFRGGEGGGGGGEGEDERGHSMKEANKIIELIQRSGLTIGSVAEVLSSLLFADSPKKKILKNVGGGG